MHFAKLYSNWNPLIATFTLMIISWILPFLLISRFIISNIFFTRVSIKQQPFHSASSNCIYSSNQETPHRFRHPPQYAFQPNHISHEFILFAPPSLNTLSSFANCVNQTVQRFFPPSHYFLSTSVALISDLSSFTLHSLLKNYVFFLITNLHSLPHY